MKRIAVFFDKPAYEHYPFSVPEYAVAYHEIADLLHRNGAEFWIVRTQESYRGNNTFSGGWRFDGAQFHAVNEDVTVDLVYDKGHFAPDATARVLNAKEITDFVTNKWLVAQRFPQFFPRTFQVSTPEEHAQRLQDLRTDTVVSKPVHGQEGKGVVIGTKEHVQHEADTFPRLLQEFIDTSEGIPGITEGHHDFRIINIDGDVGVSYIRTPPPGQLRANVAQGGKEIEVLPEHIPPEAIEIFRKVDEEFQQHPHRIYSVDMGRDTSGEWKIIELNARPAVSSRDTGKSYASFQEKLVRSLLAAAQS